MRKYYQVSSPATCTREPIGRVFRLQEPIRVAGSGIAVFFSASQCSGMTTLSASHRRRTLFGVYTVRNPGLPDWGPALGGMAHLDVKRTSAAALMAALAWAGLTASAGAQARPAGAAASATVPRWQSRSDPEPLLTAEYLEITLEHRQGAMKVLAVEKKSFARPQVLLPRFRGRFEVRLLSPSGQLRDVVRFDLPLTGGAGPPRSPDQDDVLGRKLSLGVSAKTRVRVPFDAGIASAELYDSLNKRSLAVDLSRFQPGGLPLRVKLPVRPAGPAPAPGKAGASKAGRQGRAPGK